MDSIRLYTRAKVPFDKLNLGLAWYGRSFAVGSCKGLGCKMSGGGKPGRCTGESGVKSFEEIEKEVKDNKITPTYDTTTRAYWYNYNGDFITYDKTESWNYKTQIAKDHCFGGTFIWSLDQGIPNTPIPPPPPHDVRCQHSFDDKTRAACKRMVNDIFDTNQYDLNGPDKCFAAARGLRPFPCHEGCCLYIGQGDFQSVTIRAKEVKAAALSILDQCHGEGPARRDLDIRQSPPPPAALFVAKWTRFAWVGIAGIIITSVFAALGEGFKDLWGKDEDERGEWVRKVVENITATYPEFNLVLSHHSHTPSFQEPCYHKHIEFDRPDPWGTYGYEVYLARRGRFELHGDGGWMNWGYGGYITADPENRKNLTFSPPGANYGHVTNVYGNYVENGVSKTTEEFAVGLGSYDGCATTFGVNYEDGPIVRCEDVEF